MNKVYCFIAVFLCMAFFFPTTSFGQQEEQKPVVKEEEVKRIRVNENEKSVELSAFLNRRYYRKPSTFAVTYNRGFSAKKAFFIAKASPLELYEALKKIGAIPAFKSVKENKNESEPSPLNITFSWKGSGQEYRLEDFLSNSQEKEFEFKFLGNIDSAEQFQSGELVCLDSCISGITGVPEIGDKEYERGEILFTVNQEILPSNGTEIRITFSLKTEKSETL